MMVEKVPRKIWNELCEDIIVLSSNGCCYCREIFEHLMHEMEKNYKKHKWFV